MRHCNPAAGVSRGRYGRSRGPRVRSRPGPGSPARTNAGGGPVAAAGLVPSARPPSLG
ncbi:MAG: hypothetical protein ACK52I_33235 [Pseudomonadota bacterium]